MVLGVAGSLDGGGDTALLGSIGLELVFDLDESPLEIRFGGQGTLMSRYNINAMVVVPRLEPEPGSSEPFILGIITSR